MAFTESYDSPFTKITDYELDDLGSCHWLEHSKDLSLSAYAVLTVSYPMGLGALSLIIRQPEPPHLPTPC
jgi:hypothetical protein